MQENYNIQAHYTDNPKVERSKRMVVKAPEALNNMHLYNDIDAKKKMRAINNDIYVKTEQEKSSFNKKFLKVFGGIVVTILGIIGLKKLL